MFETKNKTLKKNVSVIWNCKFYISLYMVMFYKYSFYILFLSYTVGYVDSSNVEVDNNLIKSVSNASRLWKISQQIAPKINNIQWQWCNFRFDQNFIDFCLFCVTFLIILQSKFMKWKLQLIYCLHVNWSEK